MRIYVKSDGKKIWIPMPMWMIRLGLSKAVIKLATNKVKPGEKEYIEQIDFRALSKNIGELKKHKGLTIVNVKSKDGTEVKITV